MGINEQALARERMIEQAARLRVEVLAQEAVRAAFTNALGVEPESIAEYDDDLVRDMVVSKFVIEVKEGKI